MKTACLSVLLLSAAFIVSAAYAQGQRSCSALAAYSNEGFNLEITQSRWQQAISTPGGPGAPEAELPAHCHLEGVIDRRQGFAGKEYAIGFALNLPENWNGRFLFQGGGGLNGRVAPPLGAQASGDTPALSRGFAVVSTDSGHQGEVFDASFMADQEAALNFLYLSVARVTELAKDLIESYYQKDIAYSYFMGCSTGGREGMLMSQRYPFDYDGIVAGAPAMRTGLSNLGLRWVRTQLNQAAEKDNEGLPVPGSTFSQEEQDFVVSSLLASCDAKDGLKDGLIFDTAGCDFDPMSLVCPAADGGQCLGEAQAGALSKAFSGAVDSRGYQVYPGYFFDTGIHAQRGIPGLLTGRTIIPEGPDVARALRQDVDAEYREATGPRAALGDSTSLNLNSYSGHGGKLIFYHGVSDPWFSAKDTQQYYENMARQNGGLETVQNWSRLFLVPGMGHCGGGEQTLDNFDFLSAVVDWVEADRAPEKVIATGESMPGVSRPLCSFPAHTHYSGKAVETDEDSFVCSK